MVFSWMMSEIKYNLSPKGPGSAAPASTDTGLLRQGCFSLSKMDFVRMIENRFFIPNIKKYTDFRVQFYLNKYITWLPSKKPCDLSACPRTPAWSGFAIAVLSNVLRTMLSPCHGPLLGPFWSGCRTAACPARALTCLVQTTGEESCFWCTSWKCVVCSSSPAHLKCFLGLRLSVQS